MEFNSNLKKIKPSGIRKLFDLAQGKKDLVSFGIGEPDFITPTHIREAAKKAMDEGYTHYTPNLGFPEFREALAIKLNQKNKISVTPEEVVVTSGGTEALFFSFYTLLNPGDEVIIPDPGFVTYESQIYFAGGTPVNFTLRGENNFHPDLEELKNCVTSKTKAILLNSPSNPTGAAFSEDELSAIAQLAQEKNLIVISDELYEDIVYNGREHFSIASLPGMKERTISIFGFSKSYAMTGWRLAYLAAEANLVKEMAKLLQNTAVCANSVAQRAGLAAIQSSQDCVKEMFTAYNERRNVLIKGLNEIKGLSCHAPEGTFYAFVNIKETGMSAEELSMYLLEECKVVTVPGTAFGKQGEGYIRLSFATSLEDIKEGIRRIKKGIENIK
ncbi:pyridoxal phosphate-dependent aminotransferase [bacterium]|nr:pyridoxal phosphate-dependent aminotransferase [bacterium]MBU2439868.1 pyridoxal phosphate-dependent aminotransferase [bacterium]